MSFLEFCRMGRSPSPGGNPSCCHTFRITAGSWRYCWFKDLDQTEANLPLPDFLVSWGSPSFFYIPCTLVDFHAYRQIFHYHKTSFGYEGRWVTGPTRWVSGTWAAANESIHLAVVICIIFYRKLGYRTHAVGKWHLGFCKWEYTPTHRQPIHT